MSNGSGEPSRRRRTSLPDPSPAAAVDAVGRDVLEARCAVLEHSVRNMATATADAINAARPGGAENPDRSAMGWLYFFGALKTWQALGPTHQSKSALRWDGAAMEDMRKALHAEPIFLTLESGRKVSVHPKGDYALSRYVLDSIARNWAMERRVALLALDADEVTADSMDLLAKATELEARVRAEIIAILTHPGAGVPWTDDTIWDHAIPQWTRDEVTTLDSIAIERAHLEVNLFRINSVAERTKQFVEHGNDAMPLAAFLGTMSSDLGIQPAEIARRWSLGEVFASSLARFEATERAKAKAEKNKPVGAK